MVAHGAPEPAAGGHLGGDDLLERVDDVARGVGRAVVLRQHDHRGRADETAVRLQGVEVQRHVGQPCRQDAAGRAARQIARKRVPLGHAAAQLDQLKRFRDDAKDVAAGYECGISFRAFNDLREGDIITVYTVKELERTAF